MVLRLLGRCGAQVWDNIIFGTQSYLIPKVVRCDGGDDCACVVGRRVAAGLRFPDKEATRNRTMEAEGCGSQRAFEAVLRDGPEPMV